MAFKILDEKENKLIGRREVRARITYTGVTPKRDEIKKELKGKFVVIRSIKPEFGSTSAIVEAIIYQSKEIMDKLESEHIKKRNAEPEVSQEETKEAE